MIRGVNKHIIEVSETENEYFERAILFVRPEKRQTQDGELRKNAAKLLFRMGNPNGSIKRATRLLLGVRMTCCAAAGAALTALILCLCLL